MSNAFLIIRLSIHLLTKWTFSKGCKEKCVGFILAYGIRALSLFNIELSKASTHFLYTIL